MAVISRGGGRAYPSYHVTAVKAEVTSPEKRLLMAVLLDAIEEFKAMAQAPAEGLPVTSSTKGSKDVRRRKVVAWFAARDPGSPFSFENLCEHLDLNPDCIRSRLRILAEQPSLRTRRATRTIK